MQKKNNAKEGIVAQGPELIRRSKGYKIKVAEIRRKILEKYSSEYSEATWWRKMFLRGKMEREIRKELEGLTPPHGLYLTAQGKAE